MSNKAKRRLLSVKRLLCLFLLVSFVNCDVTNDSSSTERKIDYEIHTVFGSNSSERAIPIAFSPNGNQILMSVTKSDGSKHPAIVNTDGSDFRQLTTGPGGLIRKPIGFSPDGSKVLYTLGKDIFVVDIKSLNSVKILDGIDNNDPVTGSIKPVSFSPDGQSILFNTFKGYGLGWRIYMVDIDASSLRQLTDFSTNAVGFSPDGTSILFHHSAEGEVDVWTMDSKGDNQINLTPDNDPDDVDSHQVPVTFMENGQRILYWDTSSRNAIVHMNRNGSDTTVVSLNTPDVATDATPDGKIIAFYVAEMEGVCPYCSVAEIGLIRSDGTNRTIFYEDDKIYTQIVDFSPNGKFALLGSRSSDGKTSKILMAEILD
jgi:Tol biopolymer transport system component